MTLRPLVAVIGTTGVGKSQLAVSLARSLRDASGPSKSVILSADSMQLYKGLDVITNKVTAEEMGGVEHWGLDIVTPGQGGSWEVGKWCGEADRKVGTWLTTLTPAARGSRDAADHMRRDPLLHSALPLSSRRTIFRPGAKSIQPFRRPLETTSASSGRFFASRLGGVAGHILAATTRVAQSVDRTRRLVSSNYHRRPEPPQPAQPPRGG